MTTSASIRRFLGVCGLAAMLWRPVSACPAAEIAGEDTSQGGFGRCAPVVAALEKYRHDQKHYPARERELVPRYLPEDRTYGTYRLLKGRIIHADLRLHPGLAQRIDGLDVLLGDAPVGAFRLLLRWALPGRRGARTGQIK